MTTLNIWTHPTTGEDRIYINNAPLLRGGDKVWLTKGDFFSADNVEANIKSDWLAGYAHHGFGQCATDIACGIVENALNNLGLNEDAKWDEIVANI